MQGNVSLLGGWAPRTIPVIGRFLNIFQTTISGMLQSLIPQVWQSRLLENILTLSKIFQRKWVDLFYLMANPEGQTAGGAEARSCVKFFGRHGLAERKISAIPPTRTVGGV